jgi:hypothetical protein
MGGSFSNTTQDEQEKNNLIQRVRIQSTPDPEMENTMLVEPDNSNTSSSSAASFDLYTKQQKGDMELFLKNYSIVLARYTLIRHKIESIKDKEYTRFQEMAFDLYDLKELIKKQIEIRTRISYSAYDFLFNGKKGQADTESLKKLLNSIRSNNNVFVFNFP